MGWVTLADDLEATQRHKEALDRDEHDVEAALDRLIEAGRFAVVEDICTKALAAIGKVIT